jgi:hypothetical protein
MAEKVTLAVGEELEVKSGSLVLTLVGIYDSIIVRTKVGHLYIQPTTPSQINVRNQLPEYSPKID